MNRVYKLTPVSMYDVQGLQSWLEKMAAQGLFLKTYRQSICTLTKGDPKQVRYRLEPYNFSVVNEPPDEMVALFQECGWEHVDDVNREMLIFSSADPHAPEPHTDPDIQLEQWNKLYRKARKDFYQTLFFVLVCAVIVAVALLWGGTPLTKLLTPDPSIWALAYWIVLYPLAHLAVGYTRARELAAVIRELEGAPKKFQLWFPSQQFFSWLKALFLVFLVVLLVICFLHPELGRYQPISDFTPITLATVEQSQPVEHREFIGYPDWSPICWRQWEVWDFREGSSLNIQWFDLPGWLSFLAAPSAKDLMNDAMKLDDLLWKNKNPVAWVTREYPEAGADWLSVADSEDGVYHIVTAALGDKVVRVRYSGPMNLTNCLDEIVDMIR